MKILLALLITSTLLVACSDNEESGTIAVSDVKIESAISGSDDYVKYKGTFISSTKQLVQSGKCTVSELKEMGGWMKSQNQKYEPVYFTYCGGMKISNKIYIDALTGKVSH